MEYLRTLGTAAASSLLAKSGITLPFSLGNKVSHLDGRSIWTLYEAVKKVHSFLVNCWPELTADRLLWEGRFLACIRILL